MERRDTEGGLTMATRTVDDLKRERDGHLEYGKVQSKARAGIRPVYEPTWHVYGVVEGEAATGSGAITWGRRG